MERPGSRADRYGAFGAFDPFWVGARRHYSKEETVAQTIARPDAGRADKIAIRPFKVPTVPEADVVELRRRIEATRFPDRETVADATQGVQLETVQNLARYWATQYDWRRCEARLQALPNFMTEIDGLDIHFIHVRSKHTGALPVIVTHGWPGSVVEQLKIIDPLTNPTAHGGSASDAFDVVIPSMPGYGYSGKPTSKGWGPARIGRAWIGLMKRLGYERFVAQGGDWGAVVVDLMALEGAPELLGIHTNMAGVFPAEIDQAAFVGAPAPSGLSTDERVAYERLQFVYQKGIAYGYQMGLRPQTLYGIADSPVGLAGYFLDHDARSYELISRVFQGRAEGLTRDDVLDNITITWFTNTALSGARLYWEYWGKGYFNAKGVTIPVAVSVFPDELYPAPRSWAEKAYPKLVYYNKHDRGGHFAAWEQPELLTQDVRAGFRSLR
jgi:pimeloyl-ACP methyl ester carboxylesterase